MISPECVIQFFCQLFAKIELIEFLIAFVFSCVDLIFK